MQQWVAHASQRGGTKDPSPASFPEPGCGSRESRLLSPLCHTEETEVSGIVLGPPLPPYNQSEALPRLYPWDMWAVLCIMDVGGHNTSASLASLRPWLSPWGAWRVASACGTVAPTIKQLEPEWMCFSIKKPIYSTAPTTLFSAAYTGAYRLISFADHFPLLPSVTCSPAL